LDELAYLCDDVLATGLGLSEALGWIWGSRWGRTVEEEEEEEEEGEDQARLEPGELCQPCLHSYDH